MGDVVGAIELGGTHVVAAQVSRARREPIAGTTRRTTFAPDAGRGSLLAAVRDVALGARGSTGDAPLRWGVAVPGPFDYERGIARIRGVAKLDALYGVDLREELAAALHIDGGGIRFLNDAGAFLLGEWWSGAARGHTAAMGVTLGTGLGSAFLRDGKLRRDDPDIPPGSRLDRVAFRGGAVEDVISSRGILRAYREAGSDAPDVATIAERATAGEPIAARTWHDFGTALGEFLAPWIQAFAPSCLVFGGSIARSWSLYAAPFMAACPPAGSLRSVAPSPHLAEAPLLGAALHASRDRGP